jgi:hypothetical protein
MTPHERGMNARLLIENAVFKEAFKSLEQDLTDSWKTTHPDNAKKREKLYDQLHALQDVMQKLETFIATAALDSTAR